MKEKTRQSLIRFMEDTEHLPVPGKALLISKGFNDCFEYYQGEAAKNTVFRIHSMSKMVLATAALQLFEQGLYLMEDPVSLYLPEFAHLTVWDEGEGCAKPAQNVMKIRHLFTMTSGLTYNGDDCYTARKVQELDDRLDVEFPGKTYTLQHYVAELAKIPLKFEPGTHHTYSHSHEVLGVLVERLSGMSIGDYFKKYIFDPIGMTETWFTLPSDRKDDLASYNATWWPDDLYDEGALYQQPGGGLLSTLQDFAKFAKVLTMGGTTEDGHVILGRETLKLMATDQLNDVQKQEFYLEFMKGYSYGFGVRVYIDPALGGCPGSVGEFGWCGTGGTYVLCDPAKELTLVYMHQNDPKLEEYLQPRLRAIMYSDNDLTQ